MGILRPYKQEKAKDTGKATNDTQAAPTTDSPSDAAAKGRAAKTGPTNSRKQAETQRLARLHPNLSKKERRARDRKANMAKRERAMLELDRAKERVLLRDFIDNRWTVCEFALPVTLLFFAILMIVQRINMLWAAAVTWAAYFYFLCIAIEIIWLWIKFKKLLWTKYPTSTTKGLLLHMMGRVIQIRRFRTPGTRITRGSITDWSKWSSTSPF